MGGFVQKKFSISRSHKDFLEAYREWGFSDQSSLLREALSHFMQDMKKKKRQRQMAEKARELLVDYTENAELTAFTELDGEDFYEAGRNMEH